MAGTRERAAGALAQHPEAGLHLEMQMQMGHDGGRGRGFLTKGAYGYTVVAGCASGLSKRIQPDPE